MVIIHRLETLTHKVQKKHNKKATILYPRIVAFKTWWDSCTISITSIFSTKKWNILKFIRT